MHPVGFEPTRLPSSELKSDALDHSATDAYLFFSFFISFLFLFIILLFFYFYIIIFFIAYLLFSKNYFFLIFNFLFL